MMNIFVAKLSYETREEDLTELFERYGSVSSVKVIKDKDTGRSKGYAFVEMDDDDEASAAIEALDDVELDGRNIAVKKATPKPEGGSRGGGGGFNWSFFGQETVLEGEAFFDGSNSGLHRLR